MNEKMISKSFVELEEILKRLNKNENDKIPKVFIEYISENKEKSVLKRILHKIFKF